MVDGDEGALRDILPHDGLHQDVSLQVHVVRIFGALLRLRGKVHSNG